MFAFQGELVGKEGLPAANRAAADFAGAAFLVESLAWRTVNVENLRNLLRRAGRKTFRRPADVGAEVATGEPGAMGGNRQKRGE